MLFLINGLKKNTVILLVGFEIRSQSVVGASLEPAM